MNIKNLNEEFKSVLNSAKQPAGKEPQKDTRRAKEIEMLDKWKREADQNRDKLAQESREDDEGVMKMRMVEEKKRNDDFYDSDDG